VKPRRGWQLTPEEGAQVRQFVGDAVRETVDRLLELGYLQRAEGGHGQGEKLPEAQTLSLSEPEWYAIVLAMEGKL